MSLISNKVAVGFLVAITAFFGMPGKIESAQAQASGCYVISQTAPDANGNYTVTYRCPPRGRMVYGCNRGSCWLVGDFRDEQ